MTVQDLLREERIFFAGALRGVIHSDGVIEDDEISFVDQLRREDRFSDLDDCLEAFDARLEEGSTVGDLAAEVTRIEARDLIWQKLHAISMRNGAPNDSEREFLQQIKEAWQRA